MTDHYSSQTHGASQAHLPPSMRAQKGTAGSLVVALTIGQAAGGQKNVDLSCPGRSGQQG